MRYSVVDNLHYLLLFWTDFVDYVSVIEVELLNFL